MTWILSRSTVACLPMCSLNHKYQCASFIISGHQDGLSQGLVATALTREYTLPSNIQACWYPLRSDSEASSSSFRISTDAYSIKWTTFVLNGCSLEARSRDRKWDGVGVMKDKRATAWGYRGLSRTRWSIIHSISIHRSCRRRQKSRRGRVAKTVEPICMCLWIWTHKCVFCVSFLEYEYEFEGKVVLQCVCMYVCMYISSVLLVPHHWYWCSQCKSRKGETLKNKKS